MNSVFGVARKTGADVDPFDTEYAVFLCVVFLHGDRQVVALNPLRQFDLSAVVVDDGELAETLRVVQNTPLAVRAHRNAEGVGEHGRHDREDGEDAVEEITALHGFTE